MKPPQWLCRTCGEQFSTEAARARHRTNTGHRTYQWIEPKEPTA